MDQHSAQGVDGFFLLSKPPLGMACSWSQQALRQPVIPPLFIEQPTTNKFGLPVIAFRLALFLFQLLFQLETAHNTFAPLHNVYTLPYSSANKAQCPHKV